MPIKCIWCRTPSQGDQFSRPDHVLPRAFGTFKKALTNFCVCESCNQWFGDNLERGFGRDSGEAILRLLFGVKPPSEASEVRGHRIELSIDEPPYRGAHVVLDATVDGSLVVTHIPQVGFLLPNTEEIRWFKEDELSPEKVEPFVGCVNYTFGENEADYARLEMKLTKLGFSRQETLWIRSDIDSERVPSIVQIRYQLDSEVFRAAGKIAFGYLANQAGSDFCLENDFDEFRACIRYGETDPTKFVSPSFSPILFDELRYGARQTRGHLLTVDWHPQQGAPVGSVKLFNELRYEVRFARGMRALWREIAAGHHFEIRTRTIQRLSTSRSVIFPRIQ